MFLKFRTIAIAAVGIAALLAGAINAPPADASTPDRQIWVGSPINGTRPNTAGCSGAKYPSASCSLPNVHHIAYSSTFSWGTGPDDWAADLQSVYKGEPVRLYAAPKYSGANVTAKVEVVGAACASRVIAQGGYKVQVGLYSGTLKVGTVTFAHINPTVSAGQWISRWGGQVGTVGNYAKSSCWTGMHVHVELANRHNYACYSPQLVSAPGSRISYSNYIGYLGGSYASGQHQACPAGA